LSCAQTNDASVDEKNLVEGHPRRSERKPEARGTMVYTSVMHAFVLADVSDEALLADLAALVTADLQTTAALLAHIAEVDARALYLPAACSSMHQYCLRVLRFSEDAAFKRIRAARAARKFPQIFEAIARGLVNLTAVVLLAPHLTADNVDDVLVRATHRSRGEIEILVSALAPRPDLPTRIDPVAVDSEQEPLPQLVPEPPPDVPPPAPRVKPLTPERFGLQVTISKETRDKLDRATALMRHRNPSGDIAEVLDRALDALLITLEKEKFGATSRPRAKGGAPGRGRPAVRLERGQTRGACAGRRAVHVCQRRRRAMY
jgi:hypothetical protein